MTPKKCSPHTTGLIHKLTGTVATCIASTRVEAKWAAAQKEECEHGFPLLTNKLSATGTCVKRKISPLQ